MGSLPEPSNEQKLTFIYQVLKDQESRRKRKLYLSTLKWILFLMIILNIYAYRRVIMENTYNYVANNINARLRRISEEQKSGILKGIQQLLPPSLEDTLKDVQKIILSGTGDLLPPFEVTPGTKTWATTPAKKPVKK